MQNRIILAKRIRFAGEKVSEGDHEDNSCAAHDGHHDWSLEVVTCGTEATDPP
jgi:hypothetical protein